MFYIRLTLLVISISLLACKIQENSAKIDIFVETLCPDSKNFIIGSFKRFFLKNDHDRLGKINFITYGKAIQTSPGLFTCQHGAQECFGNKILNCAQEKMSEKNSQEFLICMFDFLFSQEKNINNALAYCSSSQRTYDTLLVCANSNEGTRLLIEAGKKTPFGVPHIPYIKVNGVYSEEKEKRILDDLHSYLCEETTGDVDSCKKSFLY